MKEGDCDDLTPSCRFNNVTAVVGGCSDEVEYMALETDGRRVRPNGQRTVMHYDFDPIEPGCGDEKTLVFTLYSDNRDPIARKWVHFGCTPCLEP